jgi:ribosomal protein S18 acetylase RimI-like enzyme
MQGSDPSGTLSEHLADHSDDAIAGDSRVAVIEDALVTQWSVFGRWKHGSLRDEDGVLWFETPIAHLPYNMVMRTRIGDNVDADAVIVRIAAGFRARDVPYLWVVRPSDRPVDLGHKLARQGLDLVETATGMDIDLDGWRPEPMLGRARIEPANHDPNILRDYIELVRTYWSVPESDRHFLTGFNEEWSGDRTPGIRLVAYVDDQPVGKLFLNTSEVPERVAIYGVAVRPEARGLGIATALMSHALAHSVSLGAGRCVLHSSEMAVSLYRRMGFVERCVMYIYATGPVFGTHHH